MKKQTKIISVCMALALAAPAFSGCKRGGGSSLPTDKRLFSTRTTIAGTDRNISKKRAKNSRKP